MIPNAPFPDPAFYAPAFPEPAKPAPAKPLKERLQHLSGEILDTMEMLVADLKHTAAPPPEAPLHVERRVLANTLRLSRICPQAQCRRAQCCRGEPSHCLIIALPLLPPEQIALVFPKRGRRGATATSACKAQPSA